MSQDGIAQAQRMAASAVRAVGREAEEDSGMLGRNRSGVVRTWLLFGIAFAAAPAAAQVVVADAGDDLSLECGSSAGTPATLDGTGSTVDGASAVLDPDVDFLWTATGIDFDDDASPTPSAAFP